MRSLVFLLGFALASPAVAQTDPAAAFGARESISSISLSPDGMKIAVIEPAPAGRGARLLIGDLASGGAPRQILASSGDPDRLSRCDWATPARLICRVFMIIKGPTTLVFTRLVAVNSDGSGLKMLSAPTSASSLDVAQSGGSIIDWGSDDAAGPALITRDYIPEKSTGTHMAESRQGRGVELVDTVSLSRKMVESPRPDATDYMSDGYGTVRMMGILPRTGDGYEKGKIRYFYRKPGSRTWEAFGTIDIGDETAPGFRPSVIDRDANAVYGFDRVDGRLALFKVSLDGNLKRELVLSRPDVDVDDIVTLGRHRRVVGASYATDRRTAAYFDPELVKLRASLERALPNSPLVSFVDSSSDGQSLLLFVGSDVDPGRYYVYRKSTRQLEELLSARPQLADMKLATVRPITYPAADGTSIPGYLTLPAGSDGKNLPAIVMPHGGPGSRDEWGFDWLSQYFAARGYAVIQPNFRGSTGYGDAWFQKNGFQSWRTAIGDVNDAGRWLVKQGIAQPGKLAIFGWSYGGYAALQSSVLDPALFKAIVAVAPVTDLETLREESRDYSDYLIVNRFIGMGPHLKEGSPARNAATITAPVLLFHGTLDRNVGVGESRLMASKLKEANRQVDYVEFPGLDHYLEDATARTTMLSKSDAFLRASLGIK